MLVSKSRYTVKGTSLKNLKLSWKETISPLLNNRWCLLLLHKLSCVYWCFHHFFQKYFRNKGIVWQLNELFFFSLNISTYITFICKVNLIHKIARNRYIVIINWFINNCNRHKIYFSFMSMFIFYYFIPVKFFCDGGRKILRYLFLPSTFFFIKNLNLSLLSKNFANKLYFANTLFTKKHLLKHPNKHLSSWMSCFIPTSPSWTSFPETSFALSYSKVFSVSLNITP